MSAAAAQYWVGQPFCGQGFATEAAQRVLKFGFDDLEFNRVFACKQCCRSCVKRRRDASST
nr:GNAT family N-acetyltransferase [Paenibacillus periandrae]